MKENLDFIFLGLSHGFINDFDKEKELIEEIKPEIVLSEEMENNKLNSDEEYKNFLDNKTHSLMTSFEEVEKLAKLCKEKKIKLIGIDFKNFGFSKEVSHKLKEGQPFDSEEEIKINNLVKKREKNHLKEILKFKESSKKPILVFLGSWHLRKGGLLTKKIRKSKIIFPANKGGDLVFEPTKEKIVYMEKIIWRK